jgi:hypothetical protein
MNTCIRSDEFNFIKMQIRNIVNGYAASSDKDVLQALVSLVKERVLDVCHDFNEEQMKLLHTIEEIRDKEDAERFFLQLAPYVKSFPELTEQALKRVFPKVKRLKKPDLAGWNLQETSYISWDDKGSSQRYIIALNEDGLVGVKGVFTSSHQKGICTICKRHAEIGMFISEVKGSVMGTYTKRGNYICQDSIVCNQNIVSLESLHDFILRQRS